MINEIRLVVQLAIGLIFLLSVPGKLLDPGKFARGVVAYQILPRTIGYGVGLLLIPLEVFIAVSHLTGWLLAFAVPLGVVMIASFTTAVVVNLRRERVLSCHCFGGYGEEVVSGRTLVRLLLLLAGELLLLTAPDLFRTAQLVYPERLSNLYDLGLILFWAMFLLVAMGWLLSASEVIELLRASDPVGARASQIQPRSTRHPSDSLS